MHILMEFLFAFLIGILSIFFARKTIEFYLNETTPITFFEPGQPWYYSTVREKVVFYLGILYVIGTFQLEKAKPQQLLDIGEKPDWWLGGRTFAVVFPTLLLLPIFIYFCGLEQGTTYIAGIFVYLLNRAR